MRTGSPGPDRGADGRPRWLITQGDLALVEHIAHLGKDERLSVDDRLELLVVALASVQTSSETTSTYASPG